MRNNKSTTLQKEGTIFTISIFAAALISLTLLLPLGCLPCCPKIIAGHEFRSEEMFVCPQCPGSQVHLYFKGRYAIEEEDGSEGEDCDCDDQVLGIQMVTGQTYGPNSKIKQYKGSGDYWYFENPIDGYIQAVKRENEDEEHNIQIRLVATGDDDCSEDVLKRYVTVKPVRRGVYYDLCIPHTDDPTGSGIYWSRKAEVFGKYVVVDHVVNMNPFPIHVYHSGQEVRNLRTGQSSSVFKDKPASTVWTLDIADPVVRAEYLRNEEGFCIRVYVLCKCQ